MLHFRGSRRGFTLLEVALALALLTFAISSALPLLQQSLQDSRIRRTEAHLQQAQTALATYLRTTGRIPCPAFPGTTNGEPLGAEVGSGGNGQAVPSDCGGQLEGLLPYRTLGLAQAVAKDGWGRWLNYRINGLLAVGSLAGKPLNTGYCGVVLQGSGALLRLEDDQGYALTGGQDLAFVLVSAGENGAGAWALDQPRPTATTSVTEAENSNGDERFVSIPSSQISANYFDDWLVWQTKNNLVSYFGAGSGVGCEQ